MSIADLSIKRPIFITSLVILMMAVGILSMKKMPVDLFPNITFPIVMVSVPYPGAGPKEIETLIARPLENELGTLSGLKRIRSINKEGIATVVAEFTLETDVKYAEQQIRDRLGSARRKLPEDILEPIVRRIDPADQPVLIVSLSGPLSSAKLFDLADEKVRPRLEQVPQVGLVEVLGGRKREIRVELDREKLKQYEVSASFVANRIAASGQNIPAGRVDEGATDTVIRTLAEFKTLKEVEDTVVNFAGNDVPVTVRNVGKVIDDLEDETSRTFTNGKQSVFLYVFRQTGANTINVAENVTARVKAIAEEVARDNKEVELVVVRDTAKMIRANVDDVNESILIGIALTMLVVFFFLGNARSTFITGIALPNSLLGAFILMWLAGFSINVMSLLALSLAVGLLVDDAIVVRENIFRHMEMGKAPRLAASIGTKEVMLAVTATTLTVIAVFGPIGFLQGVVGQFFKEFGLTICFAMAISYFDAVTMAPMLSAYLAGDVHAKKKPWAITAPVRWSLAKFEQFQSWLVEVYGKVLNFVLAYPKTILTGAFGIFVASLFAASLVPKTFLPPQDIGEFSVTIEMPPGTSIDKTQDVAMQVQTELRKNKEVKDLLLTIGNRDGELNFAEFFVQLVPAKERKGSSTMIVKDRVRELLKPFAENKPIVKDIDMVMGGQRPFNLNIVGEDLETLESLGAQVFAKLKDNPALKDPELSVKAGKPEFQVVLENAKAERLGVSPALLGMELRTQVEGTVPAVFRENGLEYDIRVRLQENDRNLMTAFDKAYVPNMNQSLIKLSNVAKGERTTGPATINRQDRARFVQIGTDLTPGGAGMGAVMNEIDRMFKEDIKLPPGYSYAYVGQAESFGELMTNMLIATGLGILFIFLVLASLYESFITPLTIMLVLPLAACGAFFGLLFMGQSLDIYSMIGCVMLLGIATKNSILLVDYTNQLLREGWNRREALLEAGRVRLRPILMTSIALVAGMLPVAIGLNEASKQRTSMGIAIIGGLISSTFLTLVVIPAAFGYIDRFRAWFEGGFLRLVGYKDEPHVEAAIEAPGRASAPKHEEVSDRFPSAS